MEAARGRFQVVKNIDIPSWTGQADLSEGIEVDCQADNSPILPLGGNNLISSCPELREPPCSARLRGQDLAFEQVGQGGCALSRYRGSQLSLGAL